MKKKDLPKIIIIAIVLLFVIPFFINLSFKINSIRLLAAEWTAGDLLSFYGAVLGAFITLIGLVITLNYQSNQARKDDDVKYRPILKIVSVERGNKSLNGNYSDFIKQHNIEMSFPNNNKSINDWERRLTNHFIVELKNQGRGEATDVSLDAAHVKSVCWDKNSHLQIITSCPISLGEISVGESVLFDISLPNKMFLKRDYDGVYFISIELVISYDNIFLRNRTTIKSLFTFKVFPTGTLEAPYNYKPDFGYNSVGIIFTKLQQTKAGQ